MFLKTDATSYDKLNLAKNLCLKGIPVLPTPLDFNESIGQWGRWVIREGHRTFVFPTINPKTAQEYFERCPEADVMVATAFGHTIVINDQDLEKHRKKVHWIAKKFYQGFRCETVARAMAKIANETVTHKLPLLDDLEIEEIIKEVKGEFYEQA